MEPVFAVVGHVNKGKSSLVATLAEDDSIAVAREARTTRSCRRFDFELNSEPLFGLVDTPGFEQARRVLAWLKEREDSAAQRPELVRAFFEKHRKGDRYPEECRLLEPVLDGAGILYVVDGSQPFSPSYQAEMEILRWTGQPRMAVINRIGPEDFTTDWRKALDQYFSIVREFDAHDGHFCKRISLLEAFRELRNEWRQPLNQAIERLRADRTLRLKRTARALAELVDDSLHLTVKKKIPDAANPQTHQETLRETFLESLRTREKKQRDRVEEIFRHDTIRREESDLGLLDADLFSETTWLRLGLTRRQLAASGAVGGAFVGGSIDAAAGGATFLAGALIGGAIGGLSAWFSPKRIARVRLAGMRMGGRLLVAGPIRDKRFPWILLDRGLCHFQEVANRSHARRDTLQLSNENKEGLVARLDRATRLELDKAFSRTAKARDRETRDLELENLAERILPLLEGSNA